MNDEEPRVIRDPEIAQRLRALDAPVSDDTVNALRARILNAAAPRLAARAEQSRIQLVSRPAQPISVARPRETRRVSWLDATSGFSRVLIPLSVAAALLAMAMLRQLPAVSAVDDSTLAMASSVLGDSAMSPQIADELVLPESADEVLLGPNQSEARQ